MIIIFNTAYRRGYLGNLLRTIFLPPGVFNEYRYAIGPDAQIDEAQVCRLEQASRDGEKVLICFGDRYHNSGYEFYPVRESTLHSIRCEGSRCYIRTRLSRYLSIKSPSDFSNELYKLSRDKGVRIPSLTNGDPEYTKDGRYVFALGDDELKSVLQSNQSSWREAAEYINSSQAIQRLSPLNLIFARAQVLSSGLEVVSNDEHGDGCAKVERTASVAIRIHYYFPIQAAKQDAEAVLKVLSSPGVEVHASGTRTLGMMESAVDFPISFEPFSDKIFHSFAFSFESKQGSVEIVGPEGSVSLRASKGFAQAIGLFVSAALVLIGGAISAKDAQGLGPVIQTLGFIIGFLFVGKKIA